MGFWVRQSKSWIVLKITYHGNVQSRPRRAKFQEKVRKAEQDEEVAGLEGFEPSTHGLGNLVAALTGLKVFAPAISVNNLQT